MEYSTLNGGPKFPPKRWNFSTVKTSWKNSTLALMEKISTLKVDYSTLLLGWNYPYSTLWVEILAHPFKVENSTNYDYSAWRVAWFLNFWLFICWIGWLRDGLDMKKLSCLTSHKRKKALVARCWCSSVQDYAGKTHCTVFPDLNSQERLCKCNQQWKCTNADVNLNE